jgi:hypothetical protein
MSDQPPLPKALPDACPTEKGKSPKKENPKKSTGLWWLGSILCPIAGGALGTWGFGIVKDEPFAFSAIGLVYLGFIGGSILSFLFTIASILRHESHVSLAVSFSSIVLFLNVLIFFA